MIVTTCSLRGTTSGAAAHEECGARLGQSAPSSAAATSRTRSRQPSAIASPRLRRSYQPTRFSIQGTLRPNSRAASRRSGRLRRVRGSSRTRLRDHPYARERRLSDLSLPSTEPGPDDPGDRSASASRSRRPGASTEPGPDDPGDLRPVVSQSHVRRDASTEPGPDDPGDAARRRLRQVTGCGGASTEPGPDDPGDCARRA